MSAQKDSPPAVVVVLTTFPDLETARQIGTHLVQTQCAACVNLLGPATSVYEWEGRVETEEEIPAILKTSAPALPRLQRELEARHPYDVPEFVVLDSVSGSEAYLGWVRQMTGA